MSNFVKDSRDENIGNKYIIDAGVEDEIFKAIIKEDVVDGEFVTGNFKEYDRITRFANHEDITSEWKLDKACKKYGNAIIEFWCRGKDSGINVTESDYWWHMVYSKQYPGLLRIGVWKTSDLKQAIEDVAGLPRSKFPDWYGGQASMGDWDKKLGGPAALGHKIKEEFFFDSPHCLYEKHIDLKKFIAATGIGVYAKYKKPKKSAW